jgi:hypothetical protein
MQVSFGFDWHEGIQDIYVEICYSIEIDISIGLYQTGLKGIPATMYSVAKTKYMLNTEKKKKKR